MKRNHYEKMYQDGTKIHRHNYQYDKMAKQPSKINPVFLKDNYGVKKEEGK